MIKNTFNAILKGFVLRETKAFIDKNISFAPLAVINYILVSDEICRHSHASYVLNIRDIYTQAEHLIYREYTYFYGSYRQKKLYNYILKTGKVLNKIITGKLMSDQKRYTLKSLPLGIGQILYVKV